MSKFSRSKIRLEDACDRYLQRVANEGQSLATVRTARYTLERLVAAMGNPWMHLITPDQVDRLLYGPTGLRQGRRGKQLRASSFNRYLAVLNGLFEYADVMHWIDQNPMRSFKAATLDAPTPKLLLSAGELLTLLEVSSPVERIACSLGMNTGLRANDLRHLTVGDVSMASGLIQTEIRKTKALDNKPITMDLSRELNRWLATYGDVTGVAPEDMPNHWRLFPPYRAAPTFAADKRIRIDDPTRMYVQPWRLVQRPLTRIGHETHYNGFHTLRRSSARVFFEFLQDSGKGRDRALKIVQAYLNHKSVTTTEIYIGLDAERHLRDELLKDQPFLSMVLEQEQARIGEPATPLRSLGGQA